MIKEHLSQNLINEIKKIIPEQAENLLNSDDWSELFNAIDDEIVYDIMGHNDEPSEYGLYVQRVYDMIYDSVE